MYGIKNYCIQVPLNGITSLSNFIKIYQAVQQLLMGDTQTGDLISLFSFVVCRFKTYRKCVREVILLNIEAGLLLYEDLNLSRILYSSIGVFDHIRW
jgi:hypothetical protein